MLSIETDIIQTFPINLRTNRDAENPSVIEFIRNHSDISSLLDVGAHHSHANYAPEVRKLVKEYEAIDILSDPSTETIVDKYYIGNANNNIINKKYDCVISVSVFEHAGLSTYTAPHEKEVIKLFETCLNLSTKYLWLSFDVGQPFITPYQHSPITKGIWKKMLILIKQYKVKKRFFYTQGAQAGHPWLEHNNEDMAFKIPYISYIGNQSIGCLEIEKI
jgi:hypothetical protein